MAASLFTPARRCAGVELSPHRAAAGTAALPKLRELLAENGDAIAGADEAAAVRRRRRISLSLPLFFPSLPSLGAPRVESSLFGREDREGVRRAVYDS